MPEKLTKTRMPRPLQRPCSAPLDVNDPDWAELFTLRLDLAARNHGCGMLEMLGRMLGCKRKAIRHARKIDRSWTKKGSKPNAQAER